MQLMRLRAAVGAAVIAMGLGGIASGSEDETDVCLGKQTPIDRLLCLANVAKRAGTADPCLRARHEGVRWQCVAILAEHKKDAAPCRTIPRTNDEYRGLYDVCLSDVAKVRREPALCAEIGTDGLRDSCYLKVVKAGASNELCARIRDPGLKSACTGEAVQVR